LSSEKQKLGLVRKLTGKELARRTLDDFERTFSDIIELDGEGGLIANEGYIPHKLQRLYNQLKRKTTSYQQ